MAQLWPALIASDDFRVFMWSLEHFATPMVLFDEPVPTWQAEILRCVECDRRRRVYDKATGWYAGAIREHEAAAKGHDLQRVKALEEVVIAAEERRAHARKALKNHESTHFAMHAAEQN